MASNSLASDHWNFPTARSFQKEKEDAPMFRHDLRFALRSLRKAPGLALVVILTLTLGIGANSALFSVVNGVLLAPLPYDEPDQLVRFFDSSPNLPNFPVAPANFLDHRVAMEGQAELAIYMRSDVEWTAGDLSDRLAGMETSAGFFRLLRQEPILGRDFGRDDEEPGNEPVAIVSHRLWQSRLDGDPDVLGRPIRLDGLDHTVIGVLPQGVQHVGGSFRSLPHGTIVDIWRPMIFDEDVRSRRNQHYLNGIARLAPDLSVAEASARMNAEAERLAALYPDTNENWRVLVRPLVEDIVGASRSSILLLMAAVVLVLLIASVNVANLLLVRSTARRGEMGIRRALGASTGRLLRQVLTESLLLSTVGGLCGLGLAFVGVYFIKAWAPSQLPRVDLITVDLQVTLFTVVLSMATGLLFGLIPAFQAARTSLRSTLSTAAGGVVAGRDRLRQGLVVAELALAIMLLIGAGLLVESFLNTRDENPGFNPERVLTAEVALPSARYAEPADVARFFYEFQERLQALPGVVAAGGGSALPWTGYDENMGMRSEASLGDDEQSRQRTRFHLVTPGYFDALGIPMTYGREFEAGDDGEAEQKIIISQAMAQEFFGDEDPVGQRMTWANEPRGEQDFFRIVGVAGDVKDGPGQATLLPAIYFPMAQKTWRSDLVFGVRTEVDPSTMIATVRQELKTLDPDLPLASIQTLEQVAHSSYGEPRFLSSLVGGFAGLALLLAVIGLYGAIAYSVSQRRREMAVRMALGAPAAQLARRVLSQSLGLVILGSTLGIAGALGLTEVLRDKLWGVAPTEPRIYLICAGLLALTALFASWLPAHRASRVDPASALRFE